MDHRARFSTLNASYEDFLFAPVCEDANGMRLSVISALARTNVDPWEEATRLAAMPKAIAEKTLLSILDLVSGRSWKSPEAAAIAARLVRLLPQSGEAATTGRSGDRKCRARNRKCPQSTEKLLVAVGSHGAGDVVHDAAPSGSDIERACRHIGIRRNIPIKEQHPNSGSGRSVPIVLPFGVAVAHSYNLVRLGFVCNTRISIMPTHMPPVPPANRSKNDHGSDSGKKSRMTSW